MLVTIPYERLTAARLPWVSLGLAALWLLACVGAGLWPELSNDVALNRHQGGAAAFAGHWLFHEGWAHLAAGVILLLLLGPVLEQAWGHLFFAGFLVAALLGSNGSYLGFQSPSDRALVGASGVLAALIGACLARQWQEGLHYTAIGWFLRPVHCRFWLPAYAPLGVWFLFEVAMQLAGDGAGPTRGASYVAQVTGLLLGAATAHALRGSALEERSEARASHPALEAAERAFQQSGAAAALKILVPAVATEPNEMPLVAALCRAACTAGEREQAWGPFALLIRSQLLSDDGPAAAQLWSDWGARMERPELGPNLTLALADALAAVGQGVEAARLLRRLLDAPKDVTGGMALRIVQLARPLHAGVALDAARLALENGELPEAKRVRLRATVRELEARVALDLDPKLEVTPGIGSIDRTIDVEGRPGARRDKPAKPRPEPLDLPPIPERSSFELDAGGSLIGTGNDADVSADASTAGTPSPAGLELSGSDAEESPASLLDDVDGPDRLQPLGSGDELTEPDTAPDTVPAGRRAEAIGSLDTAPDRIDTSPPLADPAETDPSRGDFLAAGDAEPLAPLTEDGSEPAVAVGLGVAATETRFSDAKCIEVTPVSWEAGRLSIRKGQADPIPLELGRVQAVAAGAVCGLAPRPVVVVDLLLNWSELGDVPLHILRLRSDRFDPNELLPDAPNGLLAFRALVTGLLEQTGATPLPDAERASGRPFAMFDDLASYEREVLLLDR